MNLDSLFSIQERKDESLCDYVDQFNVIMLKVLDLNKSIMMSPFKRGLKSTQLPFFVDKNFIRNYIEVLTQTCMYVQVKEAMVLR